MEKMKYVVLVILLLSSCLQDVIAENLIEIYTPPPYVTSTTNSIHIVGKTDAPMVEIMVNDIKRQDLLVKDSIFHASVTFGYGINEIRITPIYSGMSTELSDGKIVEVMYGPEIEKKFYRIFAKYTFHNDTPKEMCLTCHTSTYQSLDKIDDQSNCLDCHKNMQESFKKHTVVDNKTCVNCHQLGEHLTGFYFGDDYNDNPCFNCHQDKIGQFDQDFIHGPVAGGSCRICHTPHGSKYDKSLVNPVQLLCFSCHEDMEDDLKLKNVHDPFAKGHCSACHDPHSTNNKWVLLKSSEEICMSCHQPENNLKWHTHPYNVKPKREVISKIKLNEEGMLECISCHNPHATKTESLLRIKEDFTCIGCHVDIL